jgi:hypothetical protein
MQIAFAFVCLTVIGAVAGVGAGAIGSARDMSVKQQQELDTAIDRIVADHKEQSKLRDLALATSAVGKSESAGNAVAPVSTPAVTADRKIRASENAERSESKAPARAEKASAASQQKSQRPRAGRTVARSNGLIPHAFVSLPKFATTTATSLFGLR